MSTAFDRWREGRVWCADFLAAGMPHALEGAGVDGSDEPMRGYRYPDGAWVQDLGDTWPSHARYYVVAGNGDKRGPLEDCETYLWENHSRSPEPVCKAMTAGRLLGHLSLLSAADLQKPLRVALDDDGRAIVVALLDTAPGTSIVFPTEGGALIIEGEGYSWG